MTRPPLRLLERHDSEVLDFPMASRLRQSRTPTDASLFAVAFLWAVVFSGCHASSPSEKAPPDNSTARQGTSGTPSGASAFPDSCGVEFGDVAHERGLEYHWPEQPRPLRALDAFGCGCAAFDADNDGWQDVLLVDDPRPALFRNVGGVRFEKTAGGALAEADGNWKGCAIGDYDGDGLLDVLLSGYHCLALHKNLGGLRFELATVAAGLDPANHGHWSSSAGFMDLDGDGWLDLVILNCVAFGPESKQFCEATPGVRQGCLPRSYPAEHGEIWRNTGRGVFELVPDSMGMNQTSGVGLVLAFVDLEDDGRMDFYVGNDGVPADFLNNRGAMQFENDALICGLAYDSAAQPVAAMGADWGDFDRDGRLDLTVTNFERLSFVVYHNAGDGRFADVAARTGIARATRERLGFGAKWADFENDGWLDLFFVNGHVYDNPASVQGAGSLFRQPICLLHSQSGKQFVDLVPALGRDVQRAMLGRGSANRRLQQRRPR